MNDDLELSAAGVGLIHYYESCLHPHQGKFIAYLDPVKVLTIGWGHTNHHGRKFKSGDVWSQQECDDEFLKDMRIFERDVRRLVKVVLTQRQFDALVSFAYNVGGSALGKSTLLKKLNARDYTGAANEFKRWNKAGGKVLKGLTRRRHSEANVFNGRRDPHYIEGK
jgi:lysozyme